MNLIDLIVGKPLKTSDERAEQIGPAAGIPIFGLDALSSAAYGPEAALTVLIPLGLLGVHYIIPISAATRTSPRSSFTFPTCKRSALIHPVAALTPWRVSTSAFSRDFSPPRPR